MLFDIIEILSNFQCVMYLFRFSKLSYKSEEDRMRRTEENIYKHRNTKKETQTLKGRTINCFKKNIQKEQSVLYTEILDDWLAEKRLKVKPSTYEKYLYEADTRLRPNLGHIPLSELTLNRIEEYLLSLQSDGKGLAPKTVSDILVIIKDTFNFMKSREIAAVCELKRLKIRIPQKEMRVFSLEEQEKLVSFLMKDLDISKCGILLSLYTGIRLGELCALKWENVSAEKRSIKIKGTVQRLRTNNGKNKTGLFLTEPKSDTSSRESPLPTFLSELLFQFRSESENFILSESSEHLPDPRTVQYKFKRYLSECGIGDANFHALRHTFATRCVELGFEIKSLSEILGHSSVNITLNRYVHSSLKLKADNMNKLTLPCRYPLK